MTGSEAMARQFVQGEALLRRGVRHRLQGGLAAGHLRLLQRAAGVCVAAGMTWFLTQKISWNQTSRMPHHTFWWEASTARGSSPTSLPWTSTTPRSPPPSSRTPSGTSPTTRPGLRSRCCRSATGTGAAGRPARCWRPPTHRRPRGLAEGGAGQRAGLLHPCAGRVPGRPGVAGRDVSRTTSWDAHDAGEHQAATGVASTCCRGGAVGGHRGGQGRLPVPRSTVQQCWRTVQQFHDIL